MAMGVDLMESVENACPYDGGMEQRISIANGTLESSLAHLTNVRLALGFHPH